MRTRPSITILNLDDGLMARLRARAARHGCSVEDEVRDILDCTLPATVEPAPNLAEAIRRRFAPLGGVDLGLPPREFVRDPPDFSE